MPYTLSEEKPKIAEFLAKNQVGVLATANGSGQPHAATIYFAIDPDLKVYFFTKEKTTKYSNLVENPKVALAVSEPSSQSTVQLTGTASEVKDEFRLNDAFRRILNTAANTSESGIPPVSKIAGGSYKCFCISPRIIRMAEYIKPENGRFDNLFDTVVVADNEL